MIFVAINSTDDGRITAGKKYEGMLVYKPNVAAGNSVEGQGLRVAVYDNLNKWMTFNPKIFRPQIELVSGRLT